MCANSPFFTRKVDVVLVLLLQGISMEVFIFTVKNFHFTPKFVHFWAEKFQKDQNGLRGHSRPLEAKSRNNRINMSNLTIFVGASNRRRPRMICQNATFQIKYIWIFTPKINILIYMCKLTIFQNDLGSLRGHQRPPEAKSRKTQVDIRRFLNIVNEKRI